MKIRFGRKQYIEIELKRNPTKEETQILLGKDEEKSMFELPLDLIDFDNEEIVEEDYSFDKNSYYTEIGIDAPELS